MHLHNKLLAGLSVLVLCSGAAACAAEKHDDVQSGAVSADTAATAETEQTEVSAEKERSPALKVDKIAEGIYSLDFPGSYMLDEYLEADVKTVEELDRWFMENLTNGFSTENSKYDIACSSFAAETSDGEHLFGRNYDLRLTDAMFIRTTPENGYSSIGIVDLGHLNIGQGCEAAIDSEKAPSLLLAAPYCICDGINEKGLGVSLLQLSTPHTVNDTDKHDLLLYIAMRALLDKCADTDEAVRFLSQYDMYSPSNYSYHIFLTDKSGKSVTVEWIDGEMTLTADNAVTNFILYGAPPTRDPDGRYLKMRKVLDEEGVSSKNDAMTLLEKVMQKGGTRWSAVYDLDEFTVDACFNGDYDNKYSFSGK